MKLKTSLSAPQQPDTMAFRLEDFLPYQLATASARVTRLFSRHFMQRFDITVPEWRLIVMVGRCGTLSPSAAGERAAMDKVKVSRAAASLATRGLLKQAADPHDGRGRLLSLTRKGQSVYQSLVPFARELEVGIAAGLGRTERTALQKILAKLDRHMRALDGTDEERAVADRA